MTLEMKDADAGRGALRDRLPVVDVPPDLESRVRTSLEARGLIVRHARRRISWVRHAGLLAAGVVLGVAASSLARRGDSRPAGVSAPGQYVLLLYGDPPDDTGAVHVAREREYGRWASSLHGVRWVGGHELADVVDRLGPPAPSTGTSPNADRLAGYFVIAAPSRERATEVARSCPHLKYGGRVVIMAVAS